MAQRKEKKSPDGSSSKDIAQLSLYNSEKTQKAVYGVVDDTASSSPTISEAQKATVHVSSRKPGELSYLEEFERADRALSERLAAAQTWSDLRQAFIDRNGGCYEGAKKYLSQEEQQRLVIVLAKYLQRITSAESLHLLSELPQELKRLSWETLSPPQQACIHRIRRNGGARV